jgi:MOSC domain-containing protein YiiM
VLSVNVGRPREVQHDGRIVRTGIFKSPVAGPVFLDREGFEGDGQADRRVHGGPDRAAYAYPHEHYEHWRPRLGGGELPYGQFGENLTLVGIRESDVGIGDILRVGNARVQVTAPRAPCFKLGIRTGDEDIVAPFLESGRLGFYLRVLEPGAVAAGDPVSIEERDAAGITVETLIALLYRNGPKRERALLERALTIPSLMDGLRRSLEKRRSG